MTFDIYTLASIVGLTFSTLLIAVAVQYRLNRSCRGIRWWLAGSALMAVAFVLMPLVAVPSLLVLAMIANPLLVLGQVFLYLGVARFLERKAGQWPAVVFGGFLVSYYYFMFIHNSISARTVVQSSAVAILVLMTAQRLLTRKDERTAISAHFTAGVFLLYGIFMLLRAGVALAEPPVHGYRELGPILTLAFIAPILAGTLWTFGFILMVNQRLNAEQLREGEVLQEAESALRISEETYRSILNASPDDITITDLEGRILMVSPVAVKMFGYAAGEEVGMRLDDFLAPEDHARARANILLMLQGRLRGPNEYRGLRKHREPIDIEVNSGVIHDLRGQPAKLVFIVRDITGRKQAEAERAGLEARNRQLEKAESLGRMAGAIAHQFNNHLQSVVGNLEALADPGQGQDRAGRLLRARQSAESAAEVSRMMLAYLGQTSRDQEPRRFAELCRESLAAIEAGLPAGVVLEAELPSPGPVISANPDQIQRVLGSLVANAWEAMGEAGGRIRVSLATVPAEAIPGRHRFPVDWRPQAPEYAVLEVADPGCGIAEADLERLFDPYFSTKFTGRGLGLSVLLGMVQAHGGAVTVASLPGQGSAFRVHFPVCAGAAAPLRGAAPVPAPTPGGTVLLVDDDASVLESTGAMIELMGFTARAAGDGPEALELFRRHRGEVRCVITDLTMPGMDGWQVLAALRRLDSALPVILASGYDQGQAMAGEHPEQPQAFLAKPFGIKQLRSALGRAMA